MIVYKQEDINPQIQDQNNSSININSARPLQKQQRISDIKCLLISVLTIILFSLILITILVICIKPMIYGTKISIVFFSLYNNQELNQYLHSIDNNFMGINTTVLAMHKIIPNNITNNWPNIKFVQLSNNSNLINEFKSAIFAFQTQYILVMPDWFANYTGFLQVSLAALQRNVDCSLATVKFDSLIQFHNQMLNIPILYRFSQLYQFLTKIYARQVNKNVAKIYMQNKLYNQIKYNSSRVCFIDFPMHYQDITKQYEFSQKIQKQSMHNQYSQNISNISQFTNVSHNVKYLTGLFDYLQHNCAKIVLMINCQGQCVVKLMDMPNFAYFHFHFQQLRQYDDAQIVYDWLNCDNLIKCAQYFKNNPKLIKKTKFGVSLRHKDTKYQNQSVIIKLDQLFERSGLFYDEIKSLNLMHPQRQRVRLYIRGKRGFIRPYQGYMQPTANFLSVQVVFRMIENLPYLREWLGYHINLGVDKFFLYDNSNSQRSEWQRTDYKVTKTTSKLGLDFSCFNSTEAEIHSKWTSIWLQYYEHIVYIVWEPRDEQNRIIYGQLQSLQDYMQIYSAVTQYTCFIDIDEMLFSEKDLNIQNYLRLKLKENITSLVLKPRHFASRFCYEYKKVSQIPAYFPDSTNSRRIQGPKILGVTKYFVPFGSIHEGKTSFGRQQIAAFKQLRFHHFRVSNKKQMLNDNSLHQRYKYQINRICQLGCSDTFSLSCPKGKQYGQCIKIHL